MYFTPYFMVISITYNAGLPPGDFEKFSFSFKINIMDKTLLGQLLLKARVISEKQLEEAIKIQKTEGSKIGSALIKTAAVSEENLITFLSRQYNVPPINLTDFKFDPNLKRFIPYDIAVRYHVIPLMLAGGNLRIAVADPSNHMAIEDIKFISGMNISVYVAVESLIMSAIERYYPDSEKIKKAGSPEQAKKPAQAQPEQVGRTLDKSLDELTVAVTPEKAESREIEQPVEKMLSGMLINAVKYRASDIHIEPGEDLLRVRFRIDGILKPVLKLPVQMKNVMATKVKNLFKLDAAEKQMPQTGRTKFRFGDNKEIDCRISTFPTQFGEKIVIKVVDRAASSFDISKLGFDENQLRNFTDALERPQGIVLISGPADSGKTTTIYSALLHLNKSGINIMTVEDPIEVNLFGTNQSQIKPEVGLTYAAALESLLNQDPDIIAIGELKDPSTTEIAVRIALSGRLVISTLPANESAGVLTRLINMGIEPFTIASTVSLCVSQRLVRKICENCKTTQLFDETTLMKIGFPTDMLGTFECHCGEGCDRCHNTGYSGRTAIFETLPVNTAIQELLMRNPTTAEIRHKAVMLGVTTLRQSGVRKVMDGTTSVDEVLRVTFAD
jgi:type IV pilus assembly protein PilB